MNDEITYNKPAHNYIEPKLLARIIFEAVCRKNVEAIMIRILYVLCIKFERGTETHFKTKEHFIELNQEMKNQYYYCICCLAYVNKKPNNHHKTILDHFMPECLFKDTFKNVMESKLEAFSNFYRLLIEIRILTVIF